MAQGTRYTVVLIDILLLTVFVGFTRLALAMKGLSFALEVIILLTLMFFSVIGFLGVYNKFRWGHMLVSWVFAAFLINLLFIYSRAKYVDAAFFTTTVVSALGYIISVITVKPKQMVEDLPREAEHGMPKVEIVKMYAPGKFIASKTASYYHAPNCDWAKKIAKRNTVWLESDKEAKAKGLKPHSCLGGI